MYRRMSLESNLIELENDRRKTKRVLDEKKETKHFAWNKLHFGKGTLSTGAFKQKPSRVFIYDPCEDQRKKEFNWRLSESACGKGTFAYISFYLNVVIGWCYEKPILKIVYSWLNTHLPTH